MNPEIDAHESSASLPNSEATLPGRPPDAPGPGQTAPTRPGPTTPDDTKPIVLFVGNYGSGKSEVAVNFCIEMARADASRPARRVRLADLDIVNPYFRCREARALLEAHGVGLVLPPGELLHADLPVVTPQVKGLVQRPDGLAVLDVGGDDVGATVLSSLAGAFPPDGYELLQVVNHLRPFTDTIEGVLRIQRDIETASRLAVTGLVGNSHLMDETDAAVVYAGYELTRAVAAQCGRPVRFVTAPAALVPTLDRGRLDDVPILPIVRRLLPPWRRPATEGLGSAVFRLAGKV